MPNETPPPPDNAASSQAGGLVFPSRVRALLGLPSSQAVLTPSAPPLAQRQFPYPGVAVDAGLGQWPPTAEPALPLEAPATAADSTVLEIPGFSMPKPSPRFEPADGASAGFADLEWAVDSTGAQPASANPHVGGSQPAPSPSDDADFYAHLQRVVSALSGNSTASPAAAVPRTSQTGSRPPPTPAEAAGPPAAATAKLAAQPMEAISLAALGVPPTKPGNPLGAGKPAWVSPHPEDPSEFLGDATMEPEPEAKPDLPPIHPAQQSMASALSERVEPRPQASTGSMASMGQADGPLAGNPEFSTVFHPAAAPNQATTLNPVSPARSGAADPPLTAGQMSGLGNPSPTLAHAQIADAKAQIFVPPAAKPPASVGPDAPSKVPAPPRPDPDPMSTLVPLRERVEPRPQASTGTMASMGQADGPLAGHPSRPRRNPEPSTVFDPVAAPSQATTLNPVSPARSGAADPPLTAGQMSGLGNPSPTLAHAQTSDAKAQTSVPPAAKPPASTGPDAPSKVSTPPRPGPMSTLAPTATPHPAAMPLPQLRPLAAAQVPADALEEIARLRGELAGLAEQLKARQDDRQKEAVQTPPGKPANPAPAARSSRAFWERSYVNRLYGWNRG